MRGPVRCGIVCLGVFLCLAVSGSAKESGERYRYIKDPHPDATGKVYMEREIAHVMGHLGAGWLERPQREKEEKPQLLMTLLDLQAGDAVADIGAGSGYHTRRMARAVAPGGAVYAVDIQPEMLEILTKKLKGEGIENVVPVLGKIDDPKLPEAKIDMALMVDVYHEFSHPFEMIESICRSLKVGGRLVFVEYRAEDDWVPIKPHHKMSEAQVRKEMEPHPLKWKRTVSDQFPWQHFIVFEKTGGVNVWDLRVSFIAEMRIMKLF